MKRPAKNQRPAPRAKRKPASNRVSAVRPSVKSREVAKPEAKPAGAASAVVMPLIPENVDVHPLLSALLCCAAFLDLSDEQVVSAAPSGKVLEQIGAYMHRLSDEDIDALATDLETLEAYAEEQRFPQEIIEFIRDFLVNCGFVREGEDAAEEAEED